MGGNPNQKDGGNRVDHPNKENGGGADGDGVVVGRMAVGELNLACAGHSLAVRALEEAIDREGRKPNFQSFDVLNKRKQEAW